MLRAIAIAVMVLLGGGAAANDGSQRHAPWTVKGEVGRVFDGDTFDLRTTDRRVIRIRFSGLDAPERGQAFSRRAAEHLKIVLGGRAVRARCTKTDEFRREICDVFVDGEDVGLGMVRDGLAWHFKRFQDEQSAEDRQAYSAAEDEARQRRAGLWSFQDPMPPWECRRTRREGGNCH